MYRVTSPSMYYCVVLGLKLITSAPLQKTTLTKEPPLCISNIPRFIQRATLRVHHGLIKLKKQSCHVAFKYRRKVPGCAKFHSTPRRIALCLGHKRLRPTHRALRPRSQARFPSKIHKTSTVLSKFKCATAIDRDISKSGSRDGPLVLSQPRS